MAATPPQHKPTQVGTILRVHITMLKHLPRPLCLCMAVLLAAMSYASFISAPGIQPGFGWTQETCETIVRVSAVIFGWCALVMVGMTILESSMDDSN